MLRNKFHFLLLFGYCLWTINAGEYHYKILNFDVPLDHFSFVNNKTFQIRYLFNDSYSGSDKNAPIFFYTGNEGDIELFAANTGFMWDIADEFHATLVFAEHRYYGQSMPFGNKSFSAPEFSGYLTSEQALADFAKLLSEKINPQNARPVIAFGGSYGGMLSAWMRMKYPHIIRGAIASSAPILQFIVKPDRFNTIVTSVFTVGHGNCSTNIRSTFDLLKKLVATPEGRIKITNKFQLCKNLTKPEELDILNDYLGNVYSNLAMVNYPYNTSFLAPLPANPVTEFCSHIYESYNEDQLLDAFSNALQVYTNYTGQTKCVNPDVNDDASMGYLGWNFQSCTEMVMPMCSSKKSMFPPNEWDFKAYSDKCYQQFQVRPNENMATMVYGADKLKYASNIVFSNGLMDPWSGGGVLRAANDKITIIIIPNTAHHLDLRKSHPLDPPSVINARNIEKQTIHKWIDRDSVI